MNIAVQGEKCIYRSRDVGGDVGCFLCLSAVKGQEADCTFSCE